MLHGAVRPEQLLLAASPSWEWQLRIACGYCTGLNVVDLEAITKRDIVNGVLKWRRQKTISRAELDKRLAKKP